MSSCRRQDLRKIAERVNPAQAQDDGPIGPLTADFAQDTTSTHHSKHSALPFAIELIKLKIFFPCFLATKNSKTINTLKSGIANAR